MTTRRARAPAAPQAAMADSMPLVREQVNLLGQYTFDAASAHPLVRPTSGHCQSAVV